MRAAPTVSTDGNTGRITDCRCKERLYKQIGFKSAVTANAYEKGTKVG